MERPARTVARTTRAAMGVGATGVLCMGCALALWAPVPAAASAASLAATSAPPVSPSAASLAASPAAAAARTAGPRSRGTAPLSISSVVPHALPDVERPAPAPSAPGSTAPVRSLPSTGGTPLGAGQRDAAGNLLSTVQSTNWSGELAVGIYTAISGSWTVPSLAPSIAPELVTTWVGIGGYTSTPSFPTLIQAGTVEITTGGAVADHAWVEFLPSSAMTVTRTSTPGGSASYTVSTGDVMQASLTTLGGDRWQVRLSDVTRGWTYSDTLTYVVTDTSAEWITERPLTGTAVSTLADYTTTRFTGLELESGNSGLKPPGALTAIEMVDTGNVISAPGTVRVPTPATSSTGVTFVDHYVPVPARIYGQTDDGTAAAAFENQFPFSSGTCPSSRAVVLATDANFPDALSSAYLAGVLGTGTLLTPATSLSVTAAAAIRAEGITHVYVVGGPLAVATSVVARLGSMPAYACGGASVQGGNLAVTRIYGATEYDTAEKVAQTAAALGASGSSGSTPSSAGGVGTASLFAAYAGTNATGGAGLYNATAGNESPAPSTYSALPTAILATGTHFQDAESASALAYADHLPVLLTEPGSLSPQAASAIEDLGIRQVVLMGGPLAVSDTVVTQLEALPGAQPVSVLRVAGTDDTQTAIELARCETAPPTSMAGMGWTGTGGLVVARGDFYADGLAAALVPGDGPSGTAPEPLLLTESSSVPGAYLIGYLHDAGSAGVGGVEVTQLTILGGSLAVTQGAANTMAVALST